MLQDLLTHDLKLVVCGTAVGSDSAQLKQYYAKPTNKFWKTLFQVRLTPIQLKPSEYRNLLEYGIGLTDLVKNKSGIDRDLTPGDFGSHVLLEKIKTYQPKYLCFNGKRSAVEFLLRKVDYGLQPETIKATRIFIAPSTSGAANRWWDIGIWRELTKLCNQPVN